MVENLLQMIHGKDMIKSDTEQLYFFQKPEIKSQNITLNPL